MSLTVLGNSGLTSLNQGAFDRIVDKIGVMVHRFVLFILLMSSLTVIGLL